MTYTLKNLDHNFWQKVRVMAVTRQTTIKQLILNLLEKELKEFKDD